MSVLLAHPTGNTFVREALSGLGEAGCLHSFWTAFAWPEGSMLEGLVPAGLRAELRRRAFGDVPKNLIHSRPAREILRLAGPRLGLGRLAAHERGWASVDAVFRDLSAAAGRAVLRDPAPPAAVYAYEDGALELFEAARARGLRTVYDLPIGYHAAAQRLYHEEAELFPEFAGMLDGLRDSPAKLERKTREAGLADVIVACSDFVAGTLRESGFEASRIRVVPFGAPTGIQPRTWEAGDLRRPLRLLFCGSVGQRKGFGHLLRAVRQLGRRDVELVAMGRVVGDGAPLAPYRDLFRLEGSRPHAAVLELMRSCDVLVLPSLFEGLALVQLEALACGLPLLITPNTGGAHLVREGVEGFVVPIRSAEALARRIEWLADHRDALPEMSRAAARRAQEYPWSGYRAGVLAACLEGRP